MRIPSKLLVHLRRWERTSKSGWVVEFCGCGVACVKKAWETVRVEIKLPLATRHTAITWAMQAGMDMWQATGVFGVSMNTCNATMPPTIRIIRMRPSKPRTEAAARYQTVRSDG